MDKRTVAVTKFTTQRFYKYNPLIMSHIVNMNVQCCEMTNNFNETENEITLFSNTCEVVADLKGWTFENQTSPLEGLEEIED